MNERDQQILHYNNLADTVRKQGDKQAAAQLFGQGLELMRQFGASPPVASALLSNFGILMLSMGRHADAIAMQTQALAIDMEHGGPADRAFSHHNLGNALIESGEIAGGLEQLEEARKIRESIGDFTELVITYEMMATTMVEHDAFTQARAYAERGMQLQEHLGFVPAFRGILSALSRVEAHDGNWSRACALQVRIVEFLEQMRQQRHDLTALDIYDSRYNKHYQGAIEMLLDAGEYDAALALIDRTRFRSGCDALDEVRVFGSPFESDALIASPARARELVLVEWIYPKFDWSFSMQGNLEGLELRRITTSTTEGAPAGVELESQWREHFDTTRRQSQCVIDSYADRLADVERIAWVPHGVQWHTPFAALTHPVTGAYLHQTHELLILPSLRYGAITDTRTRQTSGRYLVIGDPTDDLPGARAEAMAVAAALDVSPILGAAVTRDAVRARLNDGHYDIVHFAGHGAYSASGMHGLVLADGFFTDDDLHATALSATVVNLAACWAGMTDFSVWNELGGFVRALLIAGVGNVVGSNYPLGDTTGRIFGVAFAQRLAADITRPCSAFREALCALPSSSDRHMWGGLYITGQRDAVSAGPGDRG